MKEGLSGTELTGRGRAVEILVFPYFGLSSMEQYATAETCKN